MNSWDEIAAWQKKLENSDIVYQCEFIKGLCKTGDSLKDAANVSSLRMDGFLHKKIEYSVVAGNNDAYVYLWKHISGDVFYVGSGKKDRYKSKTRGDSFFKEIDKADSIVYIVAWGLSRADAFKLERYVSGIMSLIGFNLSNKDNNLSKDQRENFIADLPKLLYGFEKDTIEQINKSLKDIIRDNKFTYDDAMTTINFIKEYGNDFFSSGRYRDYEI